MAGILESVPTIVSIAVVAYEIVEAIVELAQDAKNIGKQMRADALPFRAFGDLIETAQYSIKFRLPQDNSAVISYMRDRLVLYNMEQEAIDLITDIQKQKHKITRLQSNFGDQANYALRFYAAHRWKNIRKPKLELLLPRMEQLKSTLQLIIAVIQLEVLSRNGGASQSSDRFNEIEKLRNLIGKHIEAIGQLRENFSEQAGMNRAGDSATGICYIAYTVAKTGRVPRHEPPDHFNFAQLIQGPILSVDPLRWNPPPDNLPAGTHICPHCNLTSDTTKRNTPNGKIFNGQNNAGRIPSGVGSSPTDRELPPLPPQSPQTQHAPILPSQQESTVVVPVSDDASSIYGHPEHQNAVIKPQPVMEPHHQPESQSESEQLRNSHPTPPPEPLDYQPNLLPQVDDFPEPPPLESLPLDDLTKGPESQHDQYLGGPVGRHLQRTRSRSRPRVPTTVEEVLVKQENTTWVKERVRFDPNLDIRNRHGLRGAEVPYGGLISESYMDSLGLRPTARWERDFLFPYDDEHRAIRGIGTVDIEWKRQSGLDDWDELVVHKPKVKCIICREMPCEERLVVK